MKNPVKVPTRAVVAYATALVALPGPVAGPVVVATALLAGTALLPSPALADTPERAAPADSIVVEIRQKREQTNLVVAQKLTPKLTAVHEAIAEAARDTKDKLDAWQANRSPASALAYDESVSRGIDSVSQALDNFLAERDGVLAAVGELGDSLGKGDASFRQKAGDYQKRAKERHEQARKLREALTELSIQYAGYVRDKKPLPLEADERARELASTLGTLETREKVLQAAAEEFKRFTGSVGTYQQVVQRYRAEYRLLFREGENAQALLADVAVSHADLKELQAVVAEVNGLGEELKGLKVRLAEVTKGLGDFLSVAGPATAGDPEAKVRAVSTDLTGTEILAGFASPEVARANR